MKLFAASVQTVHHLLIEHSHLFMKFLGLALTDHLFWKLQRILLLKLFVDIVDLFFVTLDLLIMII